MKNIKNITFRTLQIGTLIFLVFYTNAKIYEIKDYLNPQNQDRKKYIEKYKYIAIEEMEKIGVPASIKLAQGILESGDGKSWLATKANNHFGIKCGPIWKGETAYRKDDDRDKEGNLIPSCFRKYNNPEQSYRDHSKFLTDPKKEYRYGFLFDYPVTDYKRWAKGLKKAGYATNPNYANLLIGIIEANELYRYDFMDSNSFDPELAEFSRKNKVQYNNHVKMVFVQEGDDLADIAMKYNVGMSKLLDYNDLKTENVLLKEGERVYLQRKKKSFQGRKEFHTVKKGDSMYSIAQFYGIRLDKLYQKNRMFEGTEPAIGTRVSLRKKVRKGQQPQLRNMNKNLPAFTEGLEQFIIYSFLDFTEPNKPEKPKNDPKPPKTENLFHTVVKGDTLYGISRKYSVSVEQIKQLNQLESNTISVGQKLRVQ